MPSNVRRCRGAGEPCASMRSCTWQSVPVRMQHAQVPGDRGHGPVADEVGRQLCGSQQRAAPLAGSFPDLLEATVDHQGHGFRLLHPVGMHADVKDGVDDAAEQHLALLQAQGQRAAWFVVRLVAGRHHHLLGVHRPSLHEDPAASEPTDPGSRVRACAHGPTAVRDRASPRARPVRATRPRCTRGRRTPRVPRPIPRGSARPQRTSRPLTPQAARARRGTADSGTRVDLRHLDHPARRDPEPYTRSSRRTNAVVRTSASSMNGRTVASVTGRGRRHLGQRLADITSSACECPGSARHLAKLLPHAVQLLDCIRQQRVGRRVLVERMPQRGGVAVRT